MLHMYNFVTGTSVYLFNYLSGISVGAKQNKSRHLYDAFKGIIAGVYFNGVRVIDRYSLWTFYNTTIQLFKKVLKLFK